jgi:kinesin family member 18A
MHAVLQATGCGKTHTISGTDSDPGIIYLTMAELFQLIEDKADEIKVDVSVTFLEIYNEEIRDLLTEPGSHAPRGGLVIREDKSVKVSNLTELRPISAEEVKQIVLSGNARRTQSPTHANETSSRSHAVLQIHLTTAPRTADTTEMHRMATLSIIDLAGSERASATKNMGERMVEGANINKSLLALGNCINALCEAGGRKAHVPYRNSKLTRLLKFSLGGNCKTVMIVCVAPASNHFDDTHNTLVYAERAKKIKTKAVTANFINVDRHVGQYVEAINRLNAEVAELKAKLAGKVGTEAEIAKRKRSEAKAEVEKAKADMQVKLEQTRGSVADGAACQGSLCIANAKLRSIRARLAQIDSKTLDAPLSSDMTAERDFLLCLAKPEEEVMRPESALNVRVHKSNNTSSMFEAMLRAVCERKADKLEDVSIDNITLDAKAKKAEMERIKSEAETSALKYAVGNQAELLTNLIGILARCTVMLKDGSEALLAADTSSAETSGATIGLVASSFKKVAEANDSSFLSLLGHSTSSYCPTTDASSLSSFTGHSVLAIPAASVPRRSSRRVSVAQTSSSPRRFRSPRKSAVVRTSLAPSRREKEKKSLRWRDEAGEGNLDDASPGNQPNAEHNNSRQMSLGGSESEWEDEKTEDSFNVSMSFTSAPASGSKRRSRSSRLDPGFLKSKKGSSTLDSLAEDDESPTTALSRRATPLSDRGNQMDNGASPPSFSLKLPKARNAATTRVPSSVSKSGRRRSQIGPVRSEKSSRRRSSLIPQPSPPNGKPNLLGGARRVPIEGVRSPAKRAKRASLLGAPRMSGSLKVLKTSSSVVPSASTIFDQNGSACGVGKPTWR